eukprot:15047026-Ditylum_brightwellii.AAC.1
MMTSAVYFVVPINGIHVTDAITTSRIEKATIFGLNKQQVQVLSTKIQRKIWWTMVKFSFFAAYIVCGGTTVIANEGTNIAHLFLTPQQQGTTQQELNDIVERHGNHGDGSGVNKHSTKNECTDSADPFFIAGLDIENIKSGNKGGPKRKKKGMVLPRGCEWATPVNCAAYPEITKNCPASCGFCTNGGVGLLSTQNGRIDSAEQFFIAALGDERGCEWASPEHCKTYPE